MERFAVFLALTMLLTVGFSAMPSAAGTGFSGEVLGQTAGGTRGGVRFCGVRDAVYVVFQNSSFSVWKIQVAAYDLEERKWYGPFTVMDHPLQREDNWNDGHWTPSISVLPDGRLIVFYGYYTPMYFNTSIYSALHENNLTKLISCWNSARRLFPPHTDIFSYPDPIRWDDRLVVFGRDGTSYGGEYCYFVYREDQTIGRYVDGFDGSLSGWELKGDGLGNCYLDDGDYSYVWTATAGSRTGYFRFADVSQEFFEPDKAVQTYLELYATEAQQANVSVYLHGESDVLLGRLEFEGWTSFNTTGTVQKDEIAGLRMWMQSDGLGRVNVSRARIRLVYEGFGEPVTLLLPPLGYDSVYCSFSKEGDRILCGFSGYNFERRADENAYFIYSGDRGETWNLPDGTSVGLPIDGGAALACEHETRLRTAGQVLDENGRPTVLASFQKQIYADRLNGISLEIAGYSSTLGGRGEWKIENCTDVDGSQIYTSGSSLFIDPQSGRPAFWAAAGNHAAKYVREPNTTATFRKVFEGEAEVTASDVPVADADGMCETVCKENLVGALGNTAVGTLNRTLTHEEAYATRFTAAETCNLDSAVIYADSAAAEAYWQIALYNASYSIIDCSIQTSLVYGASGCGWLVSAAFQHSPQIVEGDKYWLAYRFSNSATTSKHETSTETNQTLRCTLDWSEEFPSQLQPTEFYNLTTTIAAYPCLLALRGTKTRINYTVLCVNHYGEPVPDANVTLSDQAPRGQATTGPDGKATIQTTDGTYRRTIFYRGVAVSDVTKTLTCSENETVELFTAGDNLPPAINSLARTPEQPEPDEQVKIEAEITDDLSGVHHAVLSYRADDGPWQNQTMNLNADTQLYDSLISGQPAGTNVTYAVTAYDCSGKSSEISGSYLTHGVVPEYPHILAALFAAAASSAIALRQTKRRHRRGTREGSAPA